MTVAIPAEAAEDLRTHRRPWRLAIEAMLRLAETGPNADTDDADACYWRHELAAFDRTFGAIPPRAEKEQA